MSPQLHITVAQSQAKPPLLGGIRIRQPTFVRSITKVFTEKAYNRQLSCCKEICWWVLISSMIWRQLKSGQLREDIRSVNWCCTCRLRETAGLRSFAGYLLRIGIYLVEFH
ncbi:uncharacterized protein LOC102628173 isoform X1 [Citrus sinensis]|nr:uncharacterized protein LOC102628173 isoform X1 [Citrus sinensis]